MYVCTYLDVNVSVKQVPLYVDVCHFNRNYASVCSMHMLTARKE